MSDESEKPKTQEELRADFSNEDIYFHELDRKRLVAQQARAKKRRIICHHEGAPAEGCELEEVEFHGITVDKCATCGGVWFDHHEVEDLIKRVEAETSPPVGYFKSLKDSLKFRF